VSAAADGPRAVARARGFSLEVTLRSAQMFRARREGDGFVVHAGAERFRVRQQGDRLEAQGSAGVDEAFLARFFGLDAASAEPARRLAALPELAEALAVCRGARILRQDPWECLVGFMLSSCCNVPRIERMVEALCQAAGERRGGQDGWRAFPAPGALPGEAALRRLGLGFRARYLSQVNRPETRAWLEGLRRLPFAEARRELTSLEGVGEKVADCVLLYSLGFGEAFPVDVWIRRAMQAAYFGGREAPDREIQALAAERFGRDAGYAQLVLFHLWRTRRKRA